MIVESLSELQLYINLLEQTNGNYSDSNKLIKDLKGEFGIYVTINELNRLNEPTIDDDFIDVRELLKNIYAW